MNEQTTPKMFDEAQGMALAAQNDAAAVARATQEIQAALVIAQRVGRDEIRCKTRILEACKRKELAEVSQYEYSRGGTRITGPTIDLLRAIANRWGNIRYGWTETERRDGISSVRCFAWDLFTNSQAERTFSVKHWRDTREGGHALTDERDIYELMANMAARRVRACLEEVIDSDVVQAAIDQCLRTLKDGEKTPMKDRLVKMMEFLQPFGVTQQMVETMLGNKLDAASENQYARLFRVWKSLKDGVGRVEDFFKPEPTKPDFTKGTDFTKGQQQQQPPREAEAPQPDAPTAEPVTAPAAAPSNGYNPLKALRGLLNMAKIKEGELLDYWASTGATDGSFGGLDEVMLAKPDVVNATAERWPEVDAKIKELKKKGAK